MYKKKVVQDLGLNRCTVCTIRKKIYDPPSRSPPPPKKMAPGYRWGGGVNIEKFIGGSFYPKMMILQGVGRPILPIGIQPPRLRLTSPPLFEVLFAFSGDFADTC